MKTVLGVVDFAFICVWTELHIALNAMSFTYYTIAAPTCFLLAWFASAFRDFLDMLARHIRTRKSIIDSDARFFLHDDLVNSIYLDWSITYINHAVSYWIKHWNGFFDLLFEHLGIFLVFCTSVVCIPLVFLAILTGFYKKKWHHAERPPLLHWYFLVVHF